MKYSPSILLLACANLLLPIAVIVFAVGFFPYKPILPGIASFNSEDEGRTARAEAPFDKVIFMVIDALRRLQTHICCWVEELILSFSDFVFSNSSEFKFTQRQAKFLNLTFLELTEFLQPHLLWKCHSLYGSCGFTDHNYA